MSFRDFKIKLGYAPTRRTAPFPDPKHAMENERRIRVKTEELLQEIGNVEFVGIDWLNDEGLLINPLDADTIADRFIAEKVDALFVPHANFGCEEGVARLAKKLRVPVLLWSPVDDSFPERVTDSQCGMFATSMALNVNHCPFTYVENCRLDDKKFADGLEHFIRVASVVKEFNCMRILQISVRPQSFLSVRCNEVELNEKFGFEVVSVDSNELVSTFNTCMADYAEEVDVRVAEISAKMDISQMDSNRLRRSAAVELTIEHMAKAYGCNAVASQCFELFGDLTDLWPCAAFGNMTERFLPAACETDIHGAISSVLLQAAARGESSTFLTDLTVRHPNNSCSELLWHCGVFPPSLAKDGKAKMVDMCVNEYELKPGELTICRFGGLGGKYRLFADEAKTTTGPGTDSSYVWAEFSDWAKWERKFMYGPYVHHVSVIYGKYADILHEACRYMNDVTPDYADLRE